MKSKNRMISRRNFIALFSTLTASAYAYSIIKWTKFNNSRKRKKKIGHKSKSFVYKCEMEVTELLKQKKYKEAISAIEKKYDKLKPSAGNNSGFKLLNLLAGLKLRHDSMESFLKFHDKIKDYEANNDFCLPLYDNWSTKNWMDKWLIKNSKTDNNKLKWAGNVL